MQDWTMTDELFLSTHSMLSTKHHLLMINLVAAFVLFIFMLVLLCFLRCYRFSVNRDYYISKVYMLVDL